MDEQDRRRVGEQIANRAGGPAALRPGSDATVTGAPASPGIRAGAVTARIGNHLGPPTMALAIWKGRGLGLGLVSPAW